MQPDRIRVQNGSAVNRAVIHGDQQSDAVPAARVRFGDVVRNDDLAVDASGPPGRPTVQRRWTDSAPRLSLRGRIRMECTLRSRPTGSAGVSTSSWTRWM